MVLRGRDGTICLIKEIGMRGRGGSGVSGPTSAPAWACSQASHRVAEGSYWGMSGAVKEEAAVLTN